MTRLLAGLLVLTAAVAAAPPQAGDPRPQSVTLRGRVTAEENDAVLRRVRVAAVVNNTPITPVFTDDDGRLAITVPSSSAATVTFAKAGFSTTTITLAPEALVRELTVRLARGAVITGRMVDPAGGPAADVPIEVRANPRVPGAAAVVTTTDDLGEYRFGGLAAGPYDLLAGVTRIRSETIEVRAAGFVSAADIVVPFPQTQRERRAAAPTAGPLQAQCPGPGAVRIPVVTSDGRALSGASVRLISVPRPGSPVTVYLGTETTRGDGVAIFDCLPAGDYAVEVTMRGYTVERYGNRRAARMFATVRDDTVEAAAVVLRRAATIAGLVSDEHGEPIEGATVRALALTHVNGRSTAVASGADRRTDDRGQFRIAGLQPGAYLLAATVDAELSSTNTGVTYAPTYFPGTADIRTATELRVDGDLTGVSLVLAPSQAARVTGVALDSDGNPVRGRVQLAMSQRSGAVVHAPLEMTTDEQGEFSLSNVPPGDYALKVMRPAGLGLRLEVGSAYVTVTSGTLPRVTIRTSAGSTLEGRLTVDDPEARMTGLVLTAFPLDADRVPAPPQGRGSVLAGSRGVGTFYVAGVHGPARMAITAAPESWYLKSVRIGGLEAVDAAIDPGADDVGDIEIQVSTKGASLVGRAADAGRVDDYTVVVFPADPNLRGPYSRYVKRGAPGVDGAFRISGLPPGDYLAIALDALGAGMDDARADGAWQDRAFLERLAPQASRVTLAEGERRTLTLRVVVP